MSEFRKPGLPLLCRLWGHAVDETALHYYGVVHCERCGLHGESTMDTGAREWLKVRWWLLKEWLGSYGRGILGWLHCSECGHWFGKHDDSIDHVPF